MIKLKTLRREPVLESVRIMEFNEKLQELRKQKGFTQEELAEKLYVSRTAVSKWESGRGYPNIESLKALSKLFSVTIDALLSGEEILNIAEEDHKEKKNRFFDMVFGLLDVSAVVLLFLPLFGQVVEDVVQEVSLLSLTGVAPWLRIAYLAVVICVICFGVLTLALQKLSDVFWCQNKSMMSFLLNGLALAIFILGKQPYPAILMFVFLIMKGLLVLKKQ